MITQSQYKIPATKKISLTDPSELEIKYSKNINSSEVYASDTEEIDNSEPSEVKLDKENREGKSRMGEALKSSSNQ